MHILHIIESFAAGSLTSLSTLCTHVKAQHSVVYSLRPETPNLFQNTFPHNTRFYPVPMQRNISPVQDVRSYFSILRHIRELKPDLVHCHSSKAGVLGKLAALHAGVPCAYTPHGYAFLRTDLSAPLKKFYWTVERCMAWLGQSTIACGEEEYAIAQSLYSARSQAGQNAVHLVKNSISLAPDQPFPPYPESTPVSTANTHLRVGTVGRLTEQRNPPLFSAVATDLQHAAQWVWVGAPKNHGGILPDHVQCTDWLNHDAAMAYLDTLDIYIQTSLWEGLSYSLLEAMGKGIPVIATSIPANSSVVQHAETGFLGSSPQELVGYVRTLLKDHALRQRMGAAARSYVVQHHSAQSSYAAYIPIYQAIIASKKK